MSVVTPQQARDRQWQRAKDYRLEQQTMPLPIENVVPGEIVVAKRNSEGQAWIDRFMGVATAAKVAAIPLSVTFKDFTNRRFTVDADQILKICVASFQQQAICQQRSDDVEDALDAAIEAGATADQIFAIDFTGLSLQG